MTYLLYDILLFFAYLVYIPVYALRGRLHSGIFSRLGFYGKNTFSGIRGRDVVWIHAVSVGEARAAESLLRLMRAAWPNKRIVVSTVTTTGYAIVKKFLIDGEVVFYAPLDISFAVRKALREVAPSLLVIMETEIWPNLIRLAKQRATSVVIVNGRISDRSYGRYVYIRPFLRQILEKIDMFCMQTEEASERIRALGAPKNKVKITGNIKFDISGDFKRPAVLGYLKAALDDHLVFVAGSTHENEEEEIVAIYRSLKKDFPLLRLLLAPRHLERIDKIRRVIRLQGLEAVNLSCLSEGVSISSVQIIIVDTMGDLNAIYSISDIAYVGGSLVPRGGHNPIEPALFAKPVIFGKHMDNFREIRDIFIREKAALEVDDFKSLEYEIRRLLSDPGQRDALGERAKQLISANRGAALMTFNALNEMAVR